MMPPMLVSQLLLLFSKVLLLLHNIFVLRLDLISRVMLGDGVSRTKSCSLG